jgi:serine/threonine protein kinase
MRLKMAMDIARAINFLHARSPPMIHRDLKVTLPPQDD